MMNMWCCNKTFKNIGLLALRISVGVIFIMNGYFKLTHLEMAAGMFGNFGFPMPGFTAGFVGAVELLCGLAVLLGIYTRYAAKLLAFVMLVAIVFVHLKNGDPFMQWSLAFALLGSTLALAGVGGGAWQVWRKGCGCGKGSGCNCGSGKDMGKCCGSHDERMKNGDACCKDDHMNMGEKKM